MNICGYRIIQTAILALTRRVRYSIKKDYRISVKKVACTFVCHVCRRPGASAFAVVTSHFEVDVYYNHIGRSRTILTDNWVRFSFAAMSSQSINISLIRVWLAHCWPCLHYCRAVCKSCTRNDECTLQCIYVQFFGGKSWLSFYRYLSLS